MAHRLFIPASALVSIPREDLVYVAQVESHHLADGDVGYLSAEALRIMILLATFSYDQVDPQQVVTLPLDDLRFLSYFLFGRHSSKRTGSERLSLRITTFLQGATPLRIIEPLTAHQHRFLRSGNYYDRPDEQERFSTNGTVYQRSLHRTAATQLHARCWYSEKEIFQTFSDIPNKIIQLVLARAYKEGTLVRVYHQIIPFPLFVERIRVHNED